VDKEIVMKKWLKEIASSSIPNAVDVSGNACKWIERHVPDTESWREEIMKICKNMVEFNSR
jgi:hypothetical protein